MFIKQNLVKLFLSFISSIIFSRIIKLEVKSFSLFEKYLFKIFKKIGREKFYVSEQGKYLTIYGNKPTLYLASKFSELDKSIMINKNFYLLDWVEPAVKDGSIIIDVGANTGVFGIGVSNMFPKNCLYLFELHPDLTLKLSENVNINKNQNIKIINKAVCDIDGSEDFYAINLKEEFNNGLSSLNKNAVNDLITKKIEIETLKLDTFVRDLNLSENEKISLIKIDVQGAEHRVLAGAKEVIKIHRPIIIFEHEDKFYNNPMETKLWLQSFFSSQNYKVMLISKYISKVAFEVNWSEDLEIDLIAVPL